MTINTSYSFSEPHLRSTSSIFKIFFKALITLVERAIESLNHGISSAFSINTKDIFPINLWRLELNLWWGFEKIYDAFFVKSLLILLSYEVLSSNLNFFFFKALVKLVECAINTKDIFLINLWRIEIDFLHIRTNSLKTRRLWQTWLLQALRGKLHVQTVESLLQNFILEF